MACTGCQPEKSPATATRVALGALSANWVSTCCDTVVTTSVDGVPSEWAVATAANTTAAASAYAGRHVMETERGRQSQSARLLRRGIGATLGSGGSRVRSDRPRDAR